MSSVTCGDTSILAASAHQTLGTGLGIVDACCLTRCLYNPRISSSIRPLPQPLRLTNGKSFFIYLWVFLPFHFQTAYVSRVFFSSFNRGFTNVMPSMLTLHLVLSPVEVTTTRRCPPARPRHLPHPKVLLNVLNVVQTLRDQKAKEGNDASRSGSRRENQG